jgi:tetratricopeptide (TPR) repeat protein
VIQPNRHWVREARPEVDEGIAMARQALVAARDDPEVLRIARFALAYLTGEFGAALSAFDRAIALNPNFAHALVQRALVLGWLGRSEEAILAAQQAMRLSPLDSETFQCFLALGDAHMAAGRYEEALTWAERALGENAGAARGAAPETEPPRPSRPARRSKKMSAPSARGPSRTDNRRTDAWDAEGLPPKNPPALPKGCARPACRMIDRKRR